MSEIRTESSYLVFLRPKLQDHLRSAGRSYDGLAACLPVAPRELFKFTPGSGVVLHQEAVRSHLQ